jgi:4'-phosphopantetheinyl transferase
MVDAPERPAADELHVWAADLDGLPPPQRPWRDLLSPDERERADRFLAASDRDRFVAGRGLLRTLLGRYVGRPPDALRFDYGPRGKPALVDPDGIRFNLSHAAGRALIAVALDRDVGVDLERLRPEVEVERLAERFFPPRDAAALRAAAPDRRVELFFERWTILEAILKVRGEGLAGGLAEVEVDAAGSWSRGGGSERGTVAPLEAPPGFKAAVAAEGEPLRLRRFTF